jgi:hypothetical protein
MRIHDLERFQLRQDIAAFFSQLPARGEPRAVGWVDPNITHGMAPFTFAVMAYLFSITYASSVNKISIW